MTYEEFLEWASEDVHAEWIDGEVFVQMPPKYHHQVIVAYLHELVGLFVRLLNLGVALTAPFEMRLQPRGRGLEPDLLVVLRENFARLNEDRLEGPADLVVEVLSAGTLSHDRNRKFRAYAQGGVREYWIVDSRPKHQRADFYRLDDSSQYELFATEDDERVNSTVLPGFWLKPAWLWADDRPDPIMALGEIRGVSDELGAVMQKALQKGLQSDKE